jgi:hypothetical protein
LYLLRLGAAFDVSCGADLLPEFLTLNKWQYDLLTICPPRIVEILRERAKPVQS